MKRTPTIDALRTFGGGSSAPLVLVVDDSEDSRNVVSDFLSFRGLRVELAEDGLAALDAVSRNQPDAIIMDISMPRLNGLETARRLRRAETTRKIPIIALTAYTLDATRSDIEELFDDLLMKPFDPDKLDRVLAGVLWPS